MIARASKITTYSTSIFVTDRSNYASISFRGITSLNTPLCGVQGLRPQLRSICRVIYAKLPILEIIPSLECAAGPSGRTGTGVDGRRWVCLVSLLSFRNRKR
jgi:hypothetical protein